MESPERNYQNKSFQAFKLKLQPPPLETNLDIGFLPTSWRIQEKRFLNYNDWRKLVQSLQNNHLNKHFKVIKRNLHPPPSETELNMCSPGAHTDKLNKILF